jgi:hypothetical protein
MDDIKHIPKSVSIAFEDVWEQTSVVLFSSSLGENLLTYAKEFINDSACVDKEHDNMAGAVMVDFIMWLYNNRYNGQWGEMYLGTDMYEGRNIDCGHYIVNSLTGDVVKHFEVV